MTSAVDWLEEPLNRGSGANARHVMKIREIASDQVCNPTFYNFRDDLCGWHEPGSRSPEWCPAGDRMDYRTPVTDAELDHYVHHGAPRKTALVSPGTFEWAADQCPECKRSP